MTIEKDFSTKLAAGDVTIDRRDVEMLEAIDRHGSIHRAAEELGRSYARLQNRIVKLEEATGALTERTRGGTGGGGTTLTQTGHELLQQFDRHETELDGVARATESVFTGRVVDRTGELGTVETAAGAIRALVPREGTEVQVAVRSDAVILTDPGETPDPGRTSLRNRFTGTVEDVDVGDAVANVTLSLGEDESGSGNERDRLEALITRSSLERLDLAPGSVVVASFKATAARATCVERTGSTSDGGDDER